MENKCLVAYATNSGSTQEVAEAVAEEVRKSGVAVDLRPLEEIDDLSSYTAVIIGAPMILGWHRGAVKFIKKHQQALSQRQVAYFMTAMSLTKTVESQLNGVPLLIDPNLAKEPGNPARLSLSERYATVHRYLGSVLKSVPNVKPVSVAFFGGKLEYFRLKLIQMLFVMLIVRAQPGDRRNWPVIREWAMDLPRNLALVNA
jgi:menaquinone-dependent protoporphyrinogen oxidase